MITVSPRNQQLGVRSRVGVESGPRYVSGAELLISGYFAGARRPLSSTSKVVEFHPKRDDLNPLALFSLDGVTFNIPDLSRMIAVAGEVIKDYRLELGLSEQVLGEFLGLSQKGYQKIEAVTQRTSIARIAMLCILFKRLPWEFVHNEEDAVEVLRVIEKVDVDEEAVNSIRKRKKFVGKRRTF